MMKTKTFSIITLIVFTLSLLPLTSQAAAQTPIIYLDTKGLVLSENSFDISVKTSEELRNLDIFSFMLKINFDKELLKVTDIKGKYGSDYEGVKIIENDKGSITYWYYLDDGEFKSTDDILATISFNILKVGVADVSVDADKSEFYKKDSYDNSTNEIEVELDDTAYKSSVELPVGEVKPPVFVYESEKFTTFRLVRFEDRTDGADIYYSTSNKSGLPDILYEDPISVSNTSTIKAVAVKNGVYSKTVSKKFTKESGGGPGGGGGGGGNPVVVTPVVPQTPAKKTFGDIANHWSKQYMEKLAEKSILGGYEDGTIKPDNNLTRAEAAKIIVSAIGLSPSSNISLGFADSSEIASWSAGYIQVAVEKGIIKGYEDNTFKPNQQVTRKELVVLAVRAFALSAGELGDLSFADKDKIPDWAAPSIAGALKLNIVSGYEDNTFKPDNFVTRGEASKIILICMEK